MDGDVSESVREGELLADRYRIDALIGEGGHGRVYRATQIPLGREVAVKVVSATGADALARFAREASIAQRLEHPNTVRLLDHGVSASGLPFLVLELLRGTSLRELLRTQGTLSPRVALEVTSQILRSLAEAHELGIVHRDIKPENVFVTSHFGQPVFAKVLDFGIAKQTGAGKGITIQGQTMGTPSYMAPEQTLTGVVDPRTDLYAVGLLLAEMVTGRTVMGSGGPITIMVAQAGRGPVPLDDEVRQSIVGPLVERAVQKDPADRFQTAGEMLDAIEVLMGEVNATGATPAGRRPPPRGLTEVGTGSNPFADPFQAPVFDPSPAPKIAPLPREQKRGGSISGNAMLLPGIAIGVIVSLLLAVVILLVRDARREDDRVEDGPRTQRTVVPPTEAPDPRIRRARTTQIPEIRRVLLGAGYDLSVDGGSGTTHTFAVIKQPCAGSVVLMQLHDEAQARQVAGMSPEQTRGAVYLLDGRSVITIALVRTGQGRGDVDPVCTGAVASLLQR